MKICILRNLLLIMDTSLAPSPIAKVTAFLYFLTSSTTWAFWIGVTRQHITAKKRRKVRHLGKPESLLRADIAIFFSEETTINTNKCFTASSFSVFCLLLINLDAHSVWKALDFDLRVILSERTTFSTLRFSLKIKSFTKQNMFYRSDILYDFSISSF